MSDCLLRISEVVAVNAGDITGSTLRIKSSKTDQEGRGEALYICESTRRVIKRYLRKSGIERGALFRRVRYQQHLGKGRLTANGARDAIKAVVCRSRRGRIHQWTLAPCRVCGIIGTGGGVGCGHADGGQMEVCGHAGALREGGNGGTGCDRPVQRWKVKEEIHMGRKKPTGNVENLWGDCGYYLRAV